MPTPSPAASPLWPPGGCPAHQGLVIWVETAPDPGTASEALPEVITGRNSDLQKSQTRLPLAIDYHAQAVPEISLKEGSLPDKGC